MQQVVRTCRARGSHQCVTQKSFRTPTLFMTKHRAQRLTHQIEPSALVAENVSPAACARRFSLTIAAKRDRPGPRDRNHSGFAGRRACQRDKRIVRHHVALRLDQFANVRVFIGRAAAESQAGRFKLRAFKTRFAKASAHRAEKSLATLRCPYVIAWTAAPDTDDPSRFIADK